MSLRFARVEDAGALLDIYGQYIDTPVTFEYTLPSQAEFARRIRTISAEYPYLVWEEDGRPVGYAYAHRQRERAAYQWNAELSIYLDRERVSRGIGTALYTALMELLRLQGVRTVYGVVTLPNEKSEALHRSLGFVPAGVHHATGYKNGRWHDVGWFEKRILTTPGDPEPLRPAGQIPPEEAARILARNSRPKGGKDRGQACQTWKRYDIISENEKRAKRQPEKE